MLVAALIMSVFLIASSLVTTLLIPPAEFLAAEGDCPAGKANGRALAYLAHQFFGEIEGRTRASPMSSVRVIKYKSQKSIPGLSTTSPDEPAAR